MIKNLLPKIFQKKHFFLLVYFVIYGVPFLLLIKGGGNYWDWNVPYFTDHLKNLSVSFSWQDTNFGSPLGYASSIYLSRLLSLAYYLRIPPELFLYFVIIVPATFTSYFAFLFTRRFLNSHLAFMLGLAVILNPAYFYKVLAGHFPYMVSLTIFIYLLYFVSLKLKRAWPSYLLLGLLLAFVGLQTQFFIFSAIFLLVFLLMNREKFWWKGSLLALFVALFINLPWLSNYLLGVSSVASSSQSAMEMLFAGSAFSSPIRIFFMAFSNATDIQYIYDRWMFIYFGVFAALVYGFIFYYYYLRLKRNKLVENNRKIIDVLVTNLAVFTLLGTGYFQKVNIPFLRTLYPMFRESGHFAPIIILLEVLTFAFILPVIVNSIKNYQIKINRKFLLTAYNLLLIAYLVGFISINAYCFYKYLPRVDFAAARAKFLSFEKFGQADSSTYRILSYPFWNQYGFNDVANVIKNGRLLNNSGWDSFIEFSGKEHVSNYQAGGQSINDTLQYRLLTTDNITELERKNVKYIYDLQSVYTSNFERYTTPETYDNNLSLIKNDPSFMTKLMAANPGKIIKVADNVYELNNSLPRIFLSSNQQSATSNQPTLYFEKINPTEYKISISNLKDTADLTFLESFHQDWQLYLGDNNEDISNCQASVQFSNIDATECQSTGKFGQLDGLRYLFERPLNLSHTEKFDYANNWTISKADIVNQNNKNYTVNPDGSINVDLTLYFWPQTYFVYSLAISFTALIVCLSCVFFFWLRRNRAE